MAIDANSGTELPMNPAISLFVTVKILLKWNDYLMD